MLIRLGGLFFLISLIFWLWALFDSATSEPARVRLLPKLLWFVVILLLFEIGALAWVVFGRPRAGQPNRTGGRSSGSRGSFDLGDLTSFGRGSSGGRPQRPSGPNRPVGPDDDPDFLRGLK
jgi:uncharacterized membrane protein YgcG